MKKIDIESIKKHGQIKAIDAEIDRKIFAITNRTFEGYKSGNRYSGLKKCLSSVKKQVNEIEDLLKSLNEIQPGNN